MLEELTAFDDDVLVLVLLLTDLVDFEDLPPELLFLVDLGTTLEPHLEPLPFFELLPLFFL